MNTKRSGIENLFNKVVIPIISDEKEQADYDSHAINVLEQEIAIELYKHLKEGSLAVRIMPIVKSNVSYGFNEGEREIRANVQFRKFTFCEDCPNFSQEGFNGGFCTKMREIVHITDGCTIAGDEMSYIDRDLIVHTAEAQGFEMVSVELLKQMPAADVQPVVYGEWYDVGSLSCRCNQCGCKNNKETDYCPNCGAKMRGEK